LRRRRRRRSGRTCRWRCESFSARFPFFLLVLYFVSFFSFLFSFYCETRRSYHSSDFCIHSPIPCLVLLLLLFLLLGRPIALPGLLVLDDGVAMLLLSRAISRRWRWNGVCAGVGRQPWRSCARVLECNLIDVGPTSSVFYVAGVARRALGSRACVPSLSFTLSVSHILACAHTRLSGLACFPLSFSRTIRTPWTGPGSPSSFRAIRTMWTACQESLACLRTWIWRAGLASPRLSSPLACVACLVSAGGLARVLVLLLVLPFHSIPAFTLSCRIVFEVFDATCYAVPYIRLRLGLPPSPRTAFPFSPRFPFPRAFTFAFVFEAKRAVRTFNVRVRCCSFGCGAPARASRRCSRERERERVRRWIACSLLVCPAPSAWRV
jgi:hypothetical protein